MTESEFLKQDLRDRFAMAALTGVFALEDKFMWGTFHTVEGRAKFVYQQADAMMKQREKKDE
jgi:hypothetical protein